MQYNQPYDQPNVPNAGYVNANPGTGVAGSIPPALAFEAPQREIVNLISAAGLVPTNGDMTQLLQACRSGLLDYYVDVGAVNALAIVPAPVFLGLAAGTTFKIKAKLPPTAASTLQVNNLSPIPLVKSGGNPLTGGEWQAGDIITVRFDGTNFQVSGAGSSGLVVGSTMTMNVPSTRYPTIRAALQAAAGYIILPGVYIIIAVAAGYTEQVTAATGPLYLTHPYGQRIKIVGAPIVGGMPTYSDLAGMSNAQTLALYLARFPCRINAIGVNAIEMHSGALNVLQNMLVTGDGMNTGGKYGIKVGDWATEMGFGSMGLQTVAVHGFGSDNVRAELESAIQAIDVVSTYSNAHAWHISHDSVLENNSGGLVGMYSQWGAIMQNGGQISIDRPSGFQDFAYNTAGGIGSTNAGELNAFNATGLRVRNNGGIGLNMGACSNATLQSNGGTVFNGNASGDIYMGNASTTNTYGCSLPAGCSPARGSVSSVGGAVY